jgi:hypothetical protein
MDEQGFLDDSVKACAEVQYRPLRVALKKMHVLPSLLHSSKSKNLLFEDQTGIFP